MPRAGALRCTMGLEGLGRLWICVTLILVLIRICFTVVVAATS